MAQNRTRQTGFPSVLREEYRKAIESTLTYLVENERLSRGAIANHIGVSQNIISKVSKKTDDRGPKDYHQTLIGLLQSYKENLKITDIKKFIIGTTYESIVDCKELLNHLNQVKQHSQAGLVVQSDEDLYTLINAPTYLLTYWWLREEVFPCLLQNTWIDSRNFKSELKFFKIEGKLGALKAVLQPYSQSGDGEVFSATTSILTKGKGQKDSPHVYRTSFNLKIEGDQWDRLDAGMLIAGTYSTISRKGKDEPISGLLVAEHITSMDEIMNRVRLLSLFNANQSNTASPEHQKFMLIRQLLFRENCMSHKYHQLRHPFIMSDFDDPGIDVKNRNNLFYTRNLLDYKGKYIITYINAHGPEPLVEEAILEILPNGSSTLTLPKIPLRKGIDKMTSQFSLIGKGRLLLGPFAFSRLKYAKIQFIIDCEPVNGSWYGVYAGVGQNNDQPSIGRVRMTPENLRRSNQEPLQAQYYKLSQLQEKDSDFFDLITGKKEVEGTLGPFGESQYLLDKYVARRLNFHQSIETRVYDQQTADLKIYQDFGGVFELYSLSSHESPSHIQVFPLRINSYDNRVEIKSRGNIYFAKLRFFESGILELYFDRDQKDHPHFMHKLFIVHKTKMTDDHKPKRFFGISARMNRNQALRASQDILVASTRKWEDKDFRFVEDALEDNDYKSNAEKILAFLKRNSSLITLAYAPDHSLD